MSHANISVGRLLTQLPSRHASLASMTHYLCLIVLRFLLENLK
jgi:hypothetical protein